MLGNRPSHLETSDHLSDDNSAWHPLRVTSSASCLIPEKVHRYFRMHGMESCSTLSAKPAVHHISVDVVSLFRLDCGHFPDEAEGGTATDMPFSILVRFHFTKRECQPSLRAIAELVILRKEAQHGELNGHFYRGKSKWLMQKQSIGVRCKHTERRDGRVRR